jgi:hypothetical protein
MHNVYMFCAVNAVQWWHPCRLPSMVPQIGPSSCKQSCMKHDIGEAFIDEPEIPTGFTTIMVRFVMIPFRSAALTFRISVSMDSCIFR